MPMQSMLIIGPTGSGKTPLGDYIETKGVNGKRCLHFDFGHELRCIAEGEICPDGFEKKELSFIREVLCSGALLENEHYYLAEKIIHHFMSRKRFGKDDILILNGLPRHTDQARDMSSLVSVLTLIVLECTANAVFRRIQENTGRDRTGRRDDSVEMIEKKLEVFRSRTMPLIDYYSGTGSNILRYRIDTTSSPENIYADFLSSLQYQA